jgi:hypothetical protein
MNIRYSYMLLYVIKIINKCIIYLILIKYYIMLIIGLNLLFAIEYVMCCLCKLYFDIKKIVI